MALPFPASTVCHIYRSGNAPPAAADVPNVPCQFIPAFDRGRETGEGEATGLRFTNIMLVELTTDIRDAFNEWTPGNADTIYIPNIGSIGYSVRMVERIARGTAVDHKRVYLNRKAVTWPYPVCGGGGGNGGGTGGINGNGGAVGGGSATTSTISYFNSSGTWTASSTSAVVECYGPGGTSPAVAQAAYGAGGGAYSSKTVTGLTVGNNYTVHVGTGATDDTYFDTASVVMAKAGTNATVSTAGTGGAAASGVGTTKYSGGNGGNPSGSTSGGGGGGATSSADGTNGANAAPPTGGAGGTFGGGKGADSDALNGSAGTQPGGGGGGAGASGYAGGAGRVIITPQ